ncbi:MAG: HesA/MoeB/ThiF family protein [Pseudomonadales bacterium]|nr:HesA/MoeB/ThiF family protein [Pseudomonadales bacterium]
MDDDELLRYSRHLLLPSWGEDEQQVLRQARVLLIGMGGLGSASAFYLAASGVGTMHLCDHDQVDISNLQRQILHTTATVGDSKVASAIAALVRLNPGVALVGHENKVDASFLEDLLPTVDVVLDGSDNFDTRLQVNAACVKHAIPLVSGAALGWEGQLSVYDTRFHQSPCYRCIYPEVPEETRTCHQSGVLSPLVGVMGSLMAVETIKLLTGQGVTLTGRFLLYDSRRGEFRTLKAGRDLACPVCCHRDQEDRSCHPIRM